MRAFTTQRRRFFLAFLALAAAAALLLVVSSTGFSPHRSHRKFLPTTPPPRRIPSLHRKLLAQVSAETDRIGDTCSKDDIVLIQGATSPLPNGIPTYTVQILNVCNGDSCSIGSIHLSCGWFSSARLINPRVFRRLRYDDCLVNDGRPIPSGSSLSFQYANSFRFPLSVSSASCS